MSMDQDREYKVLEAFSSTSLETVVNDAFAQGYAPAGGVTFDPSSMMFFQAVYRPRGRPTQTQP